jgi:putative peptidoglycan lipid II flippase
VAAATDGDPASYWTTSTYESFSDTKDGVGLVVDAGAARELSQLSLTTDTPGFTAEVRAGDSAEGPFETVVGAGKTVGQTTAWELDGSEHRYYTIWITALDGRAHVNEVEAS